MAAFAPRGRAGPAGNRDYRGGTGVPSVVNPGEPASSPPRWSFMGLTDPGGGRWRRLLTARLAPAAGESAGGCRNSPAEAGADCESFGDPTVRRWSSIPSREAPARDRLGQTPNRRSVPGRGCGMASGGACESRWTNSLDGSVSTASGGCPRCLLAGSSGKRPRRGRGWSPPSPGIGGRTYGAGATAWKRKNTCGPLSWIGTFLTSATSLQSERLSEDWSLRVRTLVVARGRTTPSRRRSARGAG